MDKKYLISGVLLLLVFFIYKGLDFKTKSQEQVVKKEKTMDYNNEDLERIYLAGGCFWGVDEYFDRIDGVVDVVSGYANGDTENPSYEDVIYANTGHAETVSVTYDSTKIDLTDILLYYFKVIDPISLNKQGNDVGTQYRTGIYFEDEAQIKTIEKVIAVEQEDYDQEIVVEVLPLDHFLRPKNIIKII